MKKTLVFLWLLSVVARTSSGQTGGADSASPPPPPAAQGLIGNWTEIDITSKGPCKLELSTMVVYFSEDVVVTTPTAKMTSEWLIGWPRGRSLSSFERIEAETNVVLCVTNKSGKWCHATGAKMIYTCTITNAATNEVIKLFGPPDPVVRSDQGTNSADTFTYDLTSGVIYAPGSRGKYLIPPSKKSATNAPARRRADE